MLIDLTKADSVSLQEVGGKAFNLHKLVQIGMPVPPALAVPASLHRALDVEKMGLLQSYFQKHEITNAETKFAVRSSGVGEDGEGNSYAGIFESYLNVPKEELHRAVAKVWESVDNARSTMYSNERNTFVASMGVVVQHMIDADYAGVAFSVCPIEKDPRVILIEVVAGNGDSLVSGIKTPATMRVNKLTGMSRIQRHGADQLSEEVLETIAETLTPLIEKIEAAYNIPVDIEWAVAQGKPFILQARPITA